MSGENPEKPENLPSALNLDRSAGDFSFAEDYAYDAGTGLNPDVVKYISRVKDEDPWVLEFRLKALERFEKMSNPTHWATKKLDDLDFSKIRYYLAKGEKKKKSWDEVPEDVKKTFERLGVPEQERAFLAGVEAQFDSESAYSNMKEYLQKDGVIFVDSTEGLKKYPEIFRKYFGKVIPISDNKYSALNSAVFSGGSFIYVPKGVKVAQPLQAYFRINAESFGQFERTLIIADEGAELMYMEGCTAPRFETGTLHSAVVELVALKGAKIQYVTVQNWSNNVFNLVTKRGVAEEEDRLCAAGKQLEVCWRVLAGVLNRVRLPEEELLAGQLRYRPLFDYLAEHCHAGIDVDEMARIMRMNKETFIKKFVYDTGFPPKKLFNRILVEKASRILCGSEKTIREIAAELHFCNEFYFYIFFRKHLGMTPSAFRKLYGLHPEKCLPRNIAFPAK